MFMEYNISSNKDAIINDLNLLASDAFQYALRPASMGGGEGSYNGYVIPTQLLENDNAAYTVNTAGSIGGQSQGNSHGNSQGKGYAYGHGKGGGKGSAKGKSKGKLTFMV